MSMLIDLSKREAQCLEMLCKGLTAKAIAANLGLSHCIVENYIANMKHKFKVSTKTELLKKMYGINKTVDTV